MTHKFYAHPLLIVASLLIGWNPLARADKTLKLAGGPGSIGVLEKNRVELEKVVGAKLELIKQAGDAAFVAMHKGFIDGLANAIGPNEMFNMPAVKAVKPNPGDYEWLQYGSATVMAVLNPNNPAQTLTRQQYIDLLSGKLKTWESITGKKDPVKIIFNRLQTATLKLIPQTYLGKNSVPDSSLVTSVEGLALQIKTNPGAIGFSGSKFEHEGFKPKFINTEATIPYLLTGKKPLSPEMQKLFDYYRNAAKN